MSTSPASSQLPVIAFIGGGNMASAIIGGLVRQGLSPNHIAVVEPFAEARERLAEAFGVIAEPTPGLALQGAGVVVWAVKPQTFRDAAAQARLIWTARST